jgi:hypothetical protein
MPRVELEPTIPMFKRAKTVHASGRAATVIGSFSETNINVQSKVKFSVNTIATFWEWRMASPPP